MSEMTRVLNAVPGNRMGGVHVRALLIARGLRQHGTETVFLTSDDSLGEFDIKAKDAGFQVFCVGRERPRSLMHFVNNIAWIISLFSSVRMIARIIQSENINIVHTNGLLNLAPAIAAKLTRRKLVWHLIGSHYPKWIVLGVSPLVRAVSDKVILIAESLFRYYRIDPASSQSVCLHEPVDTEYFARTLVSSSYLSNLRQSVGAQELDKLVITVGNITRAKGLEYFLEAAGKIRDHSPGTKFIIVGPKLSTQDEYWNDLQNHIRQNDLVNRVIFLGRRDDIRELLALSDVFLMTSIQEGTPIAILEAMAMEVPVVATCIAGIPEQVTHGITGFLTSPKNSEESADYTIRLLSDSSLCRTLGTEARKHILLHYSMANCVNGHIRIYESLHKRSD